MSGFGGTIDKDLLDEKGKMQCTSCHDVHITGKGENLLRWDIDDGEEVMCRVCHDNKAMGGFRERLTES